MDYKDFKSILLFSSLPAMHCEKLVEISKLVSFQPGEALFNEGEYGGDCLYCIKSGSVRIFKRVASGDEKTLAYLEAGDTLGDMTIFDESHIRSASAEAATDIQLLALNREALLNLMESHHEIGYHILKSLVVTLTDRLRKTDKNLIDVINWEFKKGA